MIPKDRDELAAKANEPLIPGPVVLGTSVGSKHIDITEPLLPEPGAAPPTIVEVANPIATTDSQISAQNQRVDRVCTPSFADWGTLPVRPVTLPLPSLCTFAAGLYLLASGTGGGKTETATALTLAVKELGNDQRVDTLYSYVFEARAAAPRAGVRPETEHEQSERAALASMKGLVALQAMLDTAKKQRHEAARSAGDDQRNIDLQKELEESRRSKLALFSEPSRFLSDVEHITAGRDGTNEVLFWAVDSVTLAIKQSFPFSRSGSPAGEKGVQPADIRFVFELSRMCLMRNVVMVALLNSQIIQFTEILEGACEGQIRLAERGAFSKRDRITREWRTIAIPKRFNEQAREILGYSKLDSSPSIYVA
jgi:hypothetical protein